MTVHFEMKLYNDQRNAHVFNLFIYLLLPYMFGLYFRSSPVYGVSARALKPYQGDLNHVEVVHLPLKMV
jgi:hypothetical protein